MSTKTAATGTITSIVAATDVRAGISGTVATATTAAFVSTGGADTLAYTVSAGPAGGTFVLASVAAEPGTLTTGTGAVGVSTVWTETGANGTAAGAGQALAGTFSVPGTYTIGFAATAGGSGAVTVNVSPGTSATTSLTAVSTTDNVVTSSNGSSVITVVRNAGAQASDGQVLLRLDATPNVTSGAIGTVYGRTSAAVGPITATQTGTTTSFTVATNTTVGANFHGVGTYRYTAFLDVNNNGVLDSGEVSVAYTHTLSAAAGKGAISATRSTIISSTTNEGSSALTPAALSSTTLNVTVSDANGNPATGSITVTESGALCVVGAPTALPLQRVGTTNVYTGTFTALADPAFTADELTAGFRECTYTANGTGATTAPTVKIKLAVLTNLAATSLSVNDAVGIGSYTGGIRQDLAVTTPVVGATAAGDKSITVDTAVTSITYKYTGNATTNQAGKYVAWVRTPGVMAAADGVNAINSAMGLAIIAADGTVTVADATTGAAGESYVMNFIGGSNAANAAVANSAAIKVTYATATPQINVLSPSAAVKAKFGDTTPVAVSLTDQFARPLASKTIVYSVSGRNPNVTGTLTTDALGAAAFNLADTSTSTSATLLITDTVALSYNYTTALGAGAVATGSASVGYSATGQVVGSVTITPSQTAAITVDTAEAKVGVPANLLTLTAQVYTAAGVAHTSGIVVKFSCTADDIFYLGASSAVTGALGTASVKVYRQKAGFTSCTATAGGVASAASLPVLWNAGAARNVAITADSATTVAGGIIRVVAKVTDRWGNGVSGAAVTFSEAGVGRIDAVAPVTDVNGQTSVDITTTSSEVGKNTITAAMTAGGQLIDFAGFVGGVAVAGVTAGNFTTSTAIEFTADKSTSTADALLALAQALGTRDQASAAIDAAAEATDASNAATDAANAAAEAADAATAAAQDAADAVAALSTQVSEMVAALKKQITSLTNLVIKIQRKVRA
jgi:trimeric autotransporter adhesin